MPETEQSGLESAAEDNEPYHTHSVCVPTILLKDDGKLNIKVPVLFQVNPVGNQYEVIAIGAKYTKTTTADQEPDLELASLFMTHTAENKEDAEKIADGRKEILAGKVNKELAKYSPPITNGNRNGNGSTNGPGSNGHGSHNVFIQLFEVG